MPSFPTPQWRPARLEQPPQVEENRTPLLELKGIRGGRLLGPLNVGGFACLIERQESVAHVREELRRQRSVGNAGGIASRHRPQVRPRPEKSVGFRNYDPRPLSIERKALLGNSG